MSVEITPQVLTKLILQAGQPTVRIFTAGVPTGGGAVSEIDDGVTATDSTWSSDKISDELADKSATGHTHDDRYYTESEVDALLAGVGGSGGGPLTIENEAGTSYTLVLADGEDSTKHKRFTAATAVTCTVPPNSSVAFEVGTRIRMTQAGAGTVTLAPGSGVTLNSRDGALTSSGQNAIFEIEKTATDTWEVLGDVGGAGAVGTQGSTSYTAVLADANTYIRFTSGSAVSFTIPPNSSVAFPIGTVIEVEQAGAGALTFVAGSGVTINSYGADLTLGGQYAVAAIKKVATDTWTATGHL